MKRRTHLVISSFFTFALILGGCQPVEPVTQTEKSQASSNPESKATVTDIEREIRKHIRETTDTEKGTFNIANDSLDLDLKLVRVHTEYLSVLGPDEFFACVDLATESGDVYDVDFFLEGSANNMTVTRTDIHKLNGKPFYTWQKTPDNTWKTVPVTGASDDLLGVLRGKDLFTFYYDVEIPALSYPAQLWVPLASSDRFQQIDIMDIQGPGEHEIRTETENGNQYLYVELTPQERSEHLTITYQVERLEKGTYREDDTKLERYLMEVPLLPVGGRFQSISEQVLAEKNADSPLTKARALYDYVIENVRYAKQGTYGTADANFACDAKSGNCTEFHSLFISLARSSGIPARFEVGAAIPSERNDGGMSGYHCWAEFYADGKWWPVDISEANKYTALATYYFGHHPANRIAFSKGRNLKVEPMPSTGAIPFFAYPILEEKGVPGPQTKTTFTFERLM